MITHCTTRYAVHPEDFKSYGTSRIREAFLVEEVMVPGRISLVYSHYDRMIVGGAVPVDGPLALETVPQIRAEYFLERREMGVINVGGEARVTACECGVGEEVPAFAGMTKNAFAVMTKEQPIVWELSHKEALYLGRGTRNVVFESVDPEKPARFYINSAPAHCTYPNRKITLQDANVLKLGSLETSNERQVNQLIINKLVQTCQLQMGLTELKPGSVWNTMPAHQHDRRMEAYFYFNVPDGQAVCHFMGEPGETRHIFLKNEQAVLSPPWSIHSAAGTSNYSFIWGMAGENLDYGDMDSIAPDQLR